MNLDIKFPPTVSAYMQSNARHRWILGPFGCLGADAEVLTTRGWVRMDAYAGEQIAQWHADTGHAEWVTPSDYIKAPCEELIRFDSGGLVMELSPEHRVPHWDWEGKFQVKTAEEIAKQLSRRHIPTTFEAPAGEGLPLTDDMLRFAVMMHADGHYPTRGQKAVVVVRKERKKTRIRQVLRALGVTWEERTYPARPTETGFYFVPPYVGKHFTPDWYAASAAQLRVIADEVVYWDGGEYGDSGTRFFSVHREDADFIQYACHATGQRAVIGYQEPRPNEQICWVVHIHDRDGPKNTAMLRCDHTQISRVPTADGHKYCFTVPTGFFVARCEGSIFVTGNSGKSVGSQVEIPRRAGMQQRSTLDGKRKTRIAVIRNTMPQLRDTTMKTWFDWFPNGSLGYYRETGKTYFIKQGDIECEVIFRALDDVSDVKNLLSLELTAAYVNEFRDIPREIIEALDGRIGRYPRMNEGGPSWVGMWGDSNMPEEGSYWHAMLEGLDPDDMKTVKPNGWDVFKQPAAMFRQADGSYRPNPLAENLANLPPGYYEALVTGKTDDFIRVNVLGEYGRSKGGKPVHPMFNKDVHVAKSLLVPNRDLLLLVSADFGLTPAMTLKQQDAFGRVLTLDEVVTFNMGLERAIEEKLLPLMRSKYDGFEVFVTGDPSGDAGAQSDETSCTDIFRRYKKKGLGKVKLAYSNATVHRRGATDHFLSRLVDQGRPAYLVSPSCEWTIAALGGKFMYKKTKDGRHTEDVDKNDWSHIGEACEYGDMYFERGGRRKAENLEKTWDDLRRQSKAETNHYATPR